MEISGFIEIGDYGDTSDAIFVSDKREPLAERLQFLIARKQVTARYWICPREMTKDEATEGFMRCVFGLAEAEFSPQYSEITGYLWTDEEIRIGGHDLLKELESYSGKWLILEIEIY